MNIYHHCGDNARLYFHSEENRSDEEELEEIISILKGAGCIVGEPMMAPDCDYFKCSIGSFPFTIIYSLDPNYGTLICCFDEQGMRQIEKIFENTEVK